MVWPTLLYCSVFANSTCFANVAYCGVSRLCRLSTRAQTYRRAHILRVGPARLKLLSKLLEHWLETLRVLQSQQNREGEPSASKDGAVIGFVLRTQFQQLLMPLDIKIVEAADLEKLSNKTKEILNEIGPPFDSLKNDARKKPRAGFPGAGLLSFGGILAKGLKTHAGGTPHDQTERIF